MELLHTSPPGTATQTNASGEAPPGTKTPSRHLAEDYWMIPLIITCQTTTVYLRLVDVWI